MIARLLRRRRRTEPERTLSRDDGMCGRLGHVATLPDLHRCTVCGAAMP